MGRIVPKNCPFSWRISTPSNRLFLGPTRVVYKLHLDQFSRGKQGTSAWPIHRQTDHATCNICSNRSHLMHCLHAMRSKITLHGSEQFIKTMKPNSLYTEERYIVINVNECASYLNLPIAAPAVKTLRLIRRHCPSRPTLKLSQNHCDSRRQRCRNTELDNKAVIVSSSKWPGQLTQRHRIFATRRPNSNAHTMNTVVEWNCHT